MTPPAAKDQCQCHNANGNSITPVTREDIIRIAAKCGQGAEAAIPILQAIQATYRYLPREALEWVCELTAITPAQLAGVSTFYSQFRHLGMGRHLIQVCHGTACHVAGAEQVSASLRRHLDLKGDEDTSRDGQFTLERVACLGCCTLAPVMLIDGITYGHLNPAKASEAVERFLKEEAEGRHAHRRQPHDAIANHQMQVGVNKTEIRVGLNSCCIASGSLDVCEALSRAARASGAEVTIKPVGCIGMCHRVPIVELVTPEGRSTLFGDNNARSAVAIIRRRIRPRGLWSRARRVVASALDLLAGEADWETARKVDASVIDPERGAGNAFLSGQVRIATERCGQLDPLDLGEYLAADGYDALRQCVLTLAPEQIIDRIDRSGLRGRGGAGFSTARKWALTRAAAGEPKFVLCNGDEGDPGAFMDRMMLEAYPHRILEGFAIAARAIGAREGYLYIRAEYALAVQRIQMAIEQAEARGILGEKMFGSDFGLKLRVMRGAGAFVCGEETAMIASIEGRRGMPRFRPPYPAESGLWGCPTSVNNVETLACLPWIVRRGPEAFAALGAGRSRGTKVFALAGKVARGGLIEVPMGTTIREIVERIGGGAKDGRRFKAVQLGGPSGGCIPAELADTPVDYEAVTATGAIMGSGGLIVMDETTCMVDMARFFLDFTQKESCGKCTFCRIGTKRMLEILERLCAGEGKPADMDNLEELAYQVKHASLCGLGKTAPNPVLTTLRYFRDEYEAHVAGRCPAGKCTALISYVVQDSCIGCTICAQECPVHAIPMNPYQKHEINDELCSRCGLCVKICPKDSIRVEPKLKS